MDPRKDGKPFCPDRVLWKLRNYIGGPWTALRHTGLTGPNKDIAAVDQICPLCLAARGDLRHVCLRCEEAGLPALLKVWWDKAADIPGRTGGPVDEWDRIPRRRAPHHPKGWKGTLGDGSEPSWPIAASLAWLLPTDHEEELAAGMAARQPA